MPHVCHIVPAHEGVSSCAADAILPTYVWGVHGWVLY